MKAVVQQSPQIASSDARLPYEAPKLVCLGDVRDLTLGGSSGTGDSGSVGAEQF
jgi:hypothetical protein